MTTTLLLLQSTITWSTCIEVVRTYQYLSQYGTASRKCTDDTVTLVPSRITKQIRMWWREHSFNTSVQVAPVDGRSTSCGSCCLKELGHTYVNSRIQPVDPTELVPSCIPAIATVRQHIESKWRIFHDHLHQILRVFVDTHETTYAQTKYVVLREERFFHQQKPSKSHKIRKPVILNCTLQLIIPCQESITSSNN